MSKSNEYGYIPESPTQAIGNNTGVFEVNDIVDLLNAGQWTLQDSLVLIETIEASGDTEVYFSDIQEDVYGVHILTVNEQRCSTGTNVTAKVRLWENGVKNTTSGDYRFTFNNIRSDNTYTFSTGTQSHLYITTSQGVANSEYSTAGYMYLFNLGDSGALSSGYFYGMGNPSDNASRTYNGVVTLQNKSLVNGISIDFNGTDTFDGKYSLYGIRKTI